MDLPARTEPSRRRPHAVEPSAQPPHGIWPCDEPSERGHTMQRHTSRGNSLQVQEVVEFLVYNEYLHILEAVVPPRPAAGYLHRKLGPDPQRAPCPPQARGGYGGRRRRGRPSHGNARTRPTQQHAPPPWTRSRDTPAPLLAQQWVQSAPHMPRLEPLY